MRRWRGLLIAAGSVLAVAVLVAVAGLPLYVFPPSDEADSADIIYVIGPPTRERLRTAEELRDRGVADRILVSVPREGAQSAAEQSFCQRDNVECVHPEPFTTAGEAALLNVYAEGGRAVVITFTPHVARTRYIFDRCFRGESVVESVKAYLNPLEWAIQYGYQTAGFIKASVTPCPKPATG